MKITIITVGKIKEKYLRDAIAEYSKRLSRYCKLEIIEVADEKTVEHASEAVEDSLRKMHTLLPLKSTESSSHRNNWLQKWNSLGYRGRAIWFLSLAGQSDLEKKSLENQTMP